METGAARRGRRASRQSTRTDHAPARPPKRSRSGSTPPVRAQRGRQERAAAAPAPEEDPCEALVRRVVGTTAGDGVLGFACAGPASAVECTLMLAAADARIAEAAAGRPVPPSRSACATCGQRHGVEVRCGGAAAFVPATSPLAATLFDDVGDTAATNSGASGKASAGAAAGRMGPPPEAATPGAAASSGSRAGAAEADTSVGDSPHGAGSALDEHHSGFSDEEDDAPLDDGDIKQMLREFVAASARERVRRSPESYGFGGLHRYIGLHSSAINVLAEAIADMAAAEAAREEEEGPAAATDEDVIREVLIYLLLVHGGVIYLHDANGATFTPRGLCSLPLSGSDTELAVVLSCVLEHVRRVLGDAAVPNDSEQRLQLVGTTIRVACEAVLRPSPLDIVEDLGAEGLLKPYLLSDPTDTEGAAIELLDNSEAVDRAIEDAVRAFAHTTAAMRESSGDDWWLEVERLRPTGCSSFGSAWVLAQVETIFGVPLQPYAARIWQLWKRHGAQPKRKAATDQPKRQARVRKRGAPRARGGGGGGAGAGAGAAS